MEDDRLRLAFRLVPVVLIAAGGAWFYASSEMEGRLREFRSEVRQQSYMRDGSLPTEAAVSARAQQLAEERQIALEDLAVTRDENGRPDGQGIAAASALGPLALTMRYTGYTVTGRARLRKWIFSSNEPLQVTFSLRREVSAPSMPGMREPTEREVRGDDPAQGRGM